MLLRSVIDFLFPRYCAYCNERLEGDENVVCTECRNEMPRTRLWTLPKTIDGVTLTAYDEETKKILFEQNNFTKLFWGRVPKIKKAMAFLRYASKTKLAKVVHDFKYHNRPDYAVEMGHMAAQELLPTGFFDGIDVLVPMPLTPKRKRERGYNQSERLAYGISMVTGIPIIENAVVRKDFVMSQTDLSQYERVENVKEAFHCGPDIVKLQGKHILLVDDIVTTGSTVTACANVIETVPNTVISVFAFAKTSKI